MLVGDFGPSLSAFPTPVSTLILRALPWTIGLLVVATLSPGCSATCSAGWPATTATPAAEGSRRRRHGPSSDALLHRRLRAADRVRLPVAGAADQRRLRRSNVDARLRASASSAACSCIRILPALSLVLVGIGALVPRHAGAGLQHRDRGLRGLCGARRRRPAAHPDFLRDAERPGPAGHRACHVARRDLHRRHHHRGGLRLSRHRIAAGRCGACRRLQPGPRRDLGVDRRGFNGGAGDRPALSASRSPRAGGAEEHVQDHPRPPALQYRVRHRRSDHR